MRDAFINNKLKRLDIVPDHYRLKDRYENNYWKKDWTGPVDISTLEYQFDSPTKKPKRLL
jgi:hypothetical protein